MTPQPPTITILNPFAPEYIPIPPPFFLPPPPSAAFPPPQSFFSPYIFTYIPSSQQPPFYTTTNFSSYPVTTPPTPLPPPPPPQISRERGRGRGVWRSCRAEKGGRGFGLHSEEMQISERNNGVGFSEKKKLICKKGMQMQRSDEKRHKVTMHLKLDEQKTTIMIKNIPYHCSRKEVVSVLDEFCLTENEKKMTDFIYAYDFVYLPIDFRTKRSRGFAFVNFTDARAVPQFFKAFNFKKWGFVDVNEWPKKIEIVSAQIQGKEALVSHFDKSNFECETDEYLPAWFCPARDGSGQAVKLTVVGNRRAPPRWAARGGGAT